MPLFKKRTANPPESTQKDVAPVAAEPVNRPAAKFGGPRPVPAGEADTGRLPRTPSPEPVPAQAAAPAPQPALTVDEAPENEPTVMLRQSGPPVVALDETLRWLRCPSLPPQQPLLLTSC